MMFKKNTTVVLFLLLLLAIGFYTASVFLYQVSLTRINDDLRKQRVEIFDLNSQAESFKINVSKLNYQVDVQNKREENLSKQFVGVREEREELEEEKTQLKQDILQKNQEISAKDNEIKELKIDISDLTKKINLMNQTVDDILDDIDDICDDAAELNLSKCEDY